MEINVKETPTKKTIIQEITIYEDYKKITHGNEEKIIRRLRLV